MVRLSRGGYTRNSAFSHLRLSLLEIETNGFKLAFSCPAIILHNPRHQAVLEQTGTMVRLQRAPVLLFVQLFREGLVCQNL